MWGITADRPIVTLYDRSYSVDATRESGRLGRLVNHSSIEYNAVSKVVEIKGTPYLCLFSSRDISVGEELLFDYGERRDVVNSSDWLKS